jgi:predicted Zn-dependent peptidase
LIIKELLALQDNLTEGELQRAKEQSKGALVFALESPSARMTRLARNELYQKEQVSEETVLQEINKTTLDDIKALAEYHFNSNKVLSMAIIVPNNSNLDKPKKLTWEV